MTKIIFYSSYTYRYLLIDFGLAQQSTAENFKGANMKNMETMPIIKRKRSDEVM